MTSLSFSYVGVMAGWAGATFLWETLKIDSLDYLELDAARLRALALWEVKNILMRKVWDYNVNENSFERKVKQKARYLPNGRTSQKGRDRSR